MTRCSRKFRFRDGKILTLGDKTKVMGILNLSIDSFSDKKIPTDFESMQKKILQLIDDGADIIDIGAQSTRPGYVEISTEEEIDRLRFLPELVKMSTVPISIDTYREEVAEFAAKSGVHILNDIHGLHGNRIAEVAKKFDLSVICMAYRRLSENVLESIKKSFAETLKIADEVGIDRNKVIFDPGIGFGKTADEDMISIARIDELKNDFPILLGASRKSFIGKKLNLDVSNRVDATGAVCVYGILHGVEIVRVHDVLEVSRMCRMVDELLKFAR